MADDSAAHQRRGVQLHHGRPRHRAERLQQSALGGLVLGRHLGFSNGGRAADESLAGAAVDRREACTRRCALLRRRLIGAVPVLLIVAVGAFLLLEAAPGDAVDAYLAGTGGGDAELVARLRAEWGLDQGPLHAASSPTWPRSLTLDLGWSTAFSRPVLDVVLERLPNTLLLMSLATAFAFAVGSALGIVAGARPGSARDRLLSIGSIAVYAMPGFWLGLVLIVVFAVDLRWLPSGGIETVASRKAGLDRALDIARAPPAAGRLARPRLSRALPPADARRHGGALVGRFRARRRRARHPAPADRRSATSRETRCCRSSPCSACNPHSMLGGSVVIESVFAIPGPRPACRGGGGAARHAAAARRRAAAQRRRGHRRQPHRRHRLCAARSARRQHRRDMKILAGDAADRRGRRRPRAAGAAHRWSRSPRRSSIPATPWPSRARR